MTKYWLTTLCLLIGAGLGFFVERTQQVSSEPIALALSHTKFLSVSEQKVSDRESTPLGTVAAFWEYSRNSLSVNSLVTPWPDSFFDHNPRCGGRKSAPSELWKDSPYEESIPMRPAPRIPKEVVDFAGSIHKKDLILKDVSVASKWQSEAIVLVTYEDPKLPVPVDTFFLLIKQSEKWKIFLISTAPAVLNDQFGKCEDTQINLEA